MAAMEFIHAEEMAIVFTQKTLYTPGYSAAHHIGLKITTSYTHSNVKLVLHNLTWFHCHTAIRSKHTVSICENLLAISSLDQMAIVAVFIHSYIFCTSK